MVYTCVIYNGHNRSDRGKLKDHTMLSQILSTKRRELWIARIGRKNWMPSPYSKVCSDHFVTGMFTFSSLCCMPIDCHVINE